MPKTFYIQSYDDWEIFLEQHDLELATLIVETAFKNLDSKKRYIHIADVDVEEEETILEITLDTDEMVHTLETNLVILEHYEEYELCIKVRNAINKLKSNG